MIKPMSQNASLVAGGRQWRRLAAAAWRIDKVSIVTRSWRFQKERWGEPRSFNSQLPRQIFAMKQNRSLAGGVTSEMALDEQLQTPRVLTEPLFAGLPRLASTVTDRTQAHILDALKLAVVRMQAAASTYGTALDCH